MLPDGDRADTDRHGRDRRCSVSSRRHDDAGTLDELSRLIDASGTSNLSCSHLVVDGHFVVDGAAGIPFATLCRQHQV